MYKYGFNCNFFSGEMNQKEFFAQKFMDYFPILMFFKNTIKVSSFLQLNQFFTLEVLKNVPTRGKICSDKSVQ